LSGFWAIFQKLSTGALQAKMAKSGLDKALKKQEEYKMSGRALQTLNFMLG